MANGVEYVWTIEDFSKLPRRVGYHRASPEFDLTTSEGLKVVWRINMHPFGRTGVCKGGVGLSLEMVRSNFESVQVTWEVGLSIEKTAKTFTKKMLAEKSEFGYYTETNEWMFNNFLTPSEANQNAVRVGKKATVHCRISNPSITGSFHHDIPLCQHSSNKFMDICWRMYKEQTLTDVTMIVGNKEFKLHKFMLAARSQIFKAMFQHNVKEVTNNQVVITDFEPDVVEEFIRFLYCNKCNLENAPQLLKLADKYFVDDLKSECEKTLIKELKTENAVQMLLLADTYRAIGLRLAALKHIKNNTLGVMETEHWGVLSKEILNDIIKQLALK